MKHLLSAWPEIIKSLNCAKRILLFTDYDGTLTPIVEKPELAIISEETRLLLKNLATQRRITVGIISGRALADLKEKVNLGEIVYAGNHGFEIEGPGINFVNPLANEVRPLFKALSHLLALALGTTRGVFIENKGLTLSVHYRQMPEHKAPYLESIVQKIVKEFQSIARFRITSGKKVYELRPDVDWDKGKAIKLLMERYNSRNTSETLPIFLGDDITDEDGFHFLKKLGKGISVHIGNNLRRTAAKYYLRSTDEVNSFLSALLSYSQTRIENQLY